MAYICNRKTPCSQCEHYKFDKKENQMASGLCEEYVWHWKGTKARRKAFRNRVRENRMAGEPKRTVRCV